MKTSVLTLREVTFRRGVTEILHGIDLTVKPGEHWALLGPNGAGKSTILAFCGARTHPTSGTVDVLGQRLGRVDLQQLRRDIGHVNPHHQVRPELSVLEVVLTGITGTIATAMRWRPTAEQKAAAVALIGEVGMATHQDAAWRTLSQGERGRTLIARALVAQPRLLLLDEPTTGLDLAAREQLLETVDRLATTEPNLASILVTHHLEDLPESTSHALVVSDGRVIAGGAIESAVTSMTISRAFEYPIEVRRRRGRWSARTASDTETAAESVPAGQPAL